MIVKRNFNPVKVLSYIWQEVLFALLWSALIWWLFWTLGRQSLALNFTPIGVLGSALAIFVAFRNNSAYGRWWEARTIWGALVNWSRVYSRMVINFVDSEAAQAEGERDAFDRYKKEMVYRHIAFVHALRLHLRKQEDWHELKLVLPEKEFRRVLEVQNKPNIILQNAGDRIRMGQGEGFLQWFHSFQIEGALAQFANHQGACERIKNTPLPRQYDFFTRLFVWTFAILLPFGLLSFFVNNPGLSWIIIPLSTIIAAVFTIMEKTGAAIEDPFENKITDVALTALCNTIERDLREMLGERELPEEAQPVDGYLW